MSLYAKYDEFQFSNRRAFEAVDLSCPGIHFSMSPPYDIPHLGLSALHHPFGPSSAHQSHLNP
jgi:hypothetical protein